MARWFSARQFARHPVVEVGATRFFAVLQCMPKPAARSDGNAAGRDITPRHVASGDSDVMPETGVSHKCAVGVERSWLRAEP